MSTSAAILNIAAYKFVTLDDLECRRMQLRKRCESLGLRGTILLAEEGINMFLAGEPESLDTFLDELRAQPEFADLVDKRSYSQQQPFRRMLVRLKKEIIAFGVDGVDPRNRTSPKLAPTELKRWLDEGRSVHLLDVRNDYEVSLGTFDAATAIGVDHFREFPEAIQQLPPQWRDEPVVMFCTGGIRCEKAGPLMEEQGFQQIYQLDGGILNYFEQCGGEHYDGDCFVFDHRVAVDAALAETGHAMCFACQAVLTVEQQQSPFYVAGKACPHCYQTNEEELAQRLQASRERIRAAATPLPGSEPYDSLRPLRVPLRVDGMLVLDALERLFPFVGRQRWRESVAAGRLCEDGRPIGLNDSVHAGQQLTHIEPHVVEPDVNADIDVLFEDEDLIVVNKPAPLPMHPCGRFNRNTLVSILNTAYSPEKVRCGHRLDANTSGIVVMTRRRAAASILQPAFQRGDVQKTYLALVRGIVPNAEFVCHEPISSEVAKAGLRTVDPAGQPAETRFKVLRTLKDSTLLEVKPITGRTNQIRIHLWHSGFPILGDPSYLPDRQLSGKQTRDVESRPMCLHAWRIAFQHPTTGEQVEFQSPKPHWADD